MFIRHGVPIRLFCSDLYAPLWEKAEIMNRKLLFLHRDNTPVHTALIIRDLQNSSHIFPQPTVFAEFTLE